ncbi:hypothetical protein SAMN06295909_2451 [Plantibacter sp. VKM Ac-1784]|uniref:Uncharacterized protein n=1 Tax=Plantibacter elymi (nom. nud.) TaxID=199708 RepID=A0ABY1RE50_9MICO|nr:hypothetical protein SAMN06295909_2451 [Plantibacter sp. VKM Ac-1784]
MSQRWVLVHEGSAYELPSQAVARFMQRRISRARSSGQVLPLCVPVPGSVDIVTVIIDASTRVSVRSPRHS